MEVCEMCLDSRALLLLLCLLRMSVNLATRVMMESWKGPSSKPSPTIPNLVGVMRLELELFGGH
jgi:hypothetical protein